VAAGFADPAWVPQKITVVAWSWIGEEQVDWRICGPMGLFGNPTLRKVMLRPLLAAIREADMLTGHNILRFDLPVLNAEAMRLGLRPIGKVLVQDTMRVRKSLGFKKGQDNLSVRYKTPGEKLSLSWQQWQDAYDTPGWPLIIERCVTDVQDHKNIRAAMLHEGHLKDPIIWRG